MKIPTCDCIAKVQHRSDIVKRCVFNATIDLFGVVETTAKTMSGYQVTIENHYCPQCGAKYQEEDNDAE